MFQVPFQNINQFGTAMADDTESVIEDSNFSITQNDDELNVKYGEYSETEFTLNSSNGEDIGPVKWEIIGLASIPVGFELEDTDNSTVLIFGTPEFTNDWCFVLQAETSNGLKTAKEICFNSQENEDASYPKFNTEQYLEPAIKNRFYQTTINVNKDSVGSYTGEILEADIPEELEIQSREGEYNFLVKGKMTETGTYRFALKIQDTDSEVGTYQQFQLTVNEEDDSDNGIDPGSGTLCPPGYYFDESVGYCVQEKLDTCPSGTFYDPQTNNCVQYPQPPPTIRCSSGYYFNHFHSRCIRVSYPICPLNYQWNSGCYKCVRLPCTCGIGYYYSWILRECAPAWNIVFCSNGYHYNSYYGRCERDYRACPYGYVWDAWGYKCYRHTRSCGWNYRWSPVSNSCVPKHVSCGYGYHYDGFRGSCVRNAPIVIVHSCGYGYHWSSSYRSCIKNRTVISRPVPVRPHCGYGTVYSPRHRSCIVRTRPTPPSVGPRPPRPPGVQPQPGPKPKPPGVKPQPGPQPKPPGVKPQPGPKPKPPGVKPQPGPKPKPPGVKPQPGPKPKPPGVKPQPGPKPKHPGVKPQPGPQPKPPGVKPQPGPKPKHPGVKPQPGPKPKPPGVKPQPRPKPKRK